MNSKERFIALRKRVMVAIAECVAEGEYGKSYEGTFEWSKEWPGYFDDETGSRGPDSYTLTLHCYLLGPARHYRWRGKTSEEVLDRAEREINEWLRQEG